MARAETKDVDFDSILSQLADKVNRGHSMMPEPL